MWGHKLSISETFVVNKMKSASRPRRTLIIVENLPVPFDRRVWQEATTLQQAGYQVSVICPTGQGCKKKREVLNGIHIYRHSLPLEARAALGYALEYLLALLWQFVLAWRIFLTRGFDAIHACNPPDNIFLVALFFKLLGKKFVFDHHDINPELYEVKFGRRDFFYRVLLAFEKWTFRTADVSIATNESYKRIAIERGRMDPEKVFVVRSGPDLDRLKIMAPSKELKRGRKFLVGYVGVMAVQDGIDCLLRAASYIVRKLGRTDVHFILVGDGTELESMKHYAKELGVTEFLTFTGFLEGQELLRVLNTIDLGVSPDKANDFNEKSTMNKTMEYMALGKPIVQFDLTEGRFTAREAALYAKKNDEVDLAKKIVRLLDDPATRARMGQFGRHRIENELEWKYEAPKLLNAYDALFENR